MTYLCDQYGVSTDDEMAIKEVIITTYRKDETENASQLFDAVDNWCEENYPGSTTMRLYAWYLVGYYMGGMQATQLFSLMSALQGDKDRSCEDSLKDAW